jgi:predicted nucleic acid-binding protein
VIVVANAGPLIALAEIGCFDLLKSLYGQIRIPPAVRDEVVVSRDRRPGAQEVAAAGWIEVENVRDLTAVRILRERLDRGESEAIVLAIELDADLLLIDEARGRRIAESRGLNKTGTLGTLILAKQRGLITSITPLLDELLARGFRLHKELYQTVRALADEN